MAKRIVRQPAPRKRRQAAPPRSRASQRVRGIELQLGYPGLLRPMMIEHSRTEEGSCLTVYAGVRGEFLAAGVPADLIPSEGSSGFKIRLHESLIDAVMTTIGERIELEIDWYGHNMPRDFGHEAVCELARMMLRDLSYWFNDHSLPTPDLERPIKKLIADQRATDFRPAKGSPRLQISPEFHERLREIANDVYNSVHRFGEVFEVPSHAKKAEPPQPGLRLAVNNTR